MDYAKLALLKAEELERKGKDAAGSALSRTGLIFEKTIAAGEEYKICSVTGKGEAGVIVSLAFSSASNGAGGLGGTNDGTGEGFNGELAFIIGKKTVFTRPLSATPLFMASVLLNGESRICIKPDATVKLVSADVMVIGGEVVNSAAYGAHVAQNNDITAVVYINDGEIRASVSNANGLPDMTKYTVVGFGNSVAVTALLAAGAENFAVCHIDNEKNVFLSVVGSSGEIQSCDRLDIAADNVALISLSGSQLAIGYCCRGYAYATVLSYPDMTQDYTIKLEEATSIEFIRECRPPAIILGKNGGNVIRLAQEELSNDEAISIFVDCYHG